MPWSTDHARKTYSVPHWAEGYFDVDAAGRIVVSPKGAQGPLIPLPEVVDAARAQGAQLPLLVRFPDILGDRLGKLQAAFAQAQADWEYKGGYTAVYPIKVNQHRGVAGTLASHAGEGFGLEAGSKPELMAVLALSRPGGLIVCNGYKDREYIRLALIGRKLGLQTFIVIEKPSELALVIEESRALGVKPGLGVRMRLATLGAGKWQNSGGDKAKFGLSPRQVLDLWKQLREAGLQDTLNLLHFHMGSQISNVRDIANGMREATRYFIELSKLGASISHVDVGGGLGIDYEGTRSRSYCSINYGIGQYASNIVQPLAEACEQHGLTPRIVTECGRAMTAHHAVLVVNVSEVEQAPEGRVPPAHDDEPAVIRHLREIHGELDTRPAVELFHEAQHHHSEGLSLYCWARSTWSTVRASTTCSSHRACRACAPEQRRAQPPRPAGRTQRTAGRQVFRQLQRVRVDSRRVGHRPGVPDRADRTPRRSAGAARHHRRHDLRLRRHGEDLCRERGPGFLAAAACHEARRKLSPRDLPGGRLSRKSSATSTTCSATPTRWKSAPMRAPATCSPSSVAATPPT